MRKTSAVTTLAAVAALLFAASPSPALATSSAPTLTAQSGLKTVYGWAKRSGNSAMIVTPYRAHREGTKGDWYLGRRAGDPIRIDYTEGLDYRQINKKCGYGPSPYKSRNTRSTSATGAQKCDPIHLYLRLREGRTPVKVVYDPAGPMAVKVYELVGP
ncbi:hypothetical protein ACFQ08_00625 [Streptosporangium algeriense]|uniref:DUF4822 domain-containing protein n=1 Tax=Streptosporangium algeriense TaxID=1682748 RepID=A0ABW3DKH3_9ACTN